MVNGFGYPYLGTSSGLVLDSQTKRERTKFDQRQLDILERTFLSCMYPQSQEREQLARELNLTETKIQIWFKNRRAKDRSTKTVQALEERLIEVTQQTKRTHDLGLNNNNYNPPNPSSLEHNNNNLHNNCYNNNNHNHPQLAHKSLYKKSPSGTDMEEKPRVESGKRSQQNNNNNNNNNIKATKKSRISPVEIKREQPESTMSSMHESSFVSGNASLLSDNPYAQANRSLVSASNDFFSMAAAGFNAAAATNPSWPHYPFPPYGFHPVSYSHPAHPYPTAAFPAPNPTTPAINAGYGLTTPNSAVGFPYDFYNSDPFKANSNFNFFPKQE